MKRVLLVTGGSRGIGAGVCKIGAQRGMAVCVNYVANKERAEKVAEEVRDYGVEAITHKADVGNPDHVEVMFARIDQELGPITDLVNNAGVMGSVGRVDEIDVEKTKYLFDVNILGPLYCSKAAIKRMSTRYGGPGGAIVNVSSSSAIHGGIGNYIDYAVTKGALETFTHALAREVAAENIRVNCVRPGYTRTEMNVDFFAKRPEMEEKLLSGIAMGRSCDVSEMASAIFVFLSDQTSYATGAVMDVTGGWTCP